MTTVFYTQVTGLPRPLLIKTIKNLNAISKQILINNNVIINLYSNLFLIIIIQLHAFYLSKFNYFFFT